MCNLGWAIIADSGDMDVNGKQGTTIMRQLLSLQQMLQRCVSMEQVDSKDNTAMVTVHLGMWPHCNADACQDVLASGHVCKHIRFVYHQHLGIGWDDKQSVQTCLTMSEAQKVLSKAPSAPSATTMPAQAQAQAPPPPPARQANLCHKLVNMGEPSMNGLACASIKHKNGNKWEVKVGKGNQQITFVVCTTNLDPQPSCPTTSRHRSPAQSQQTPRAHNTSSPGAPVTQPQGRATGRAVKLAIEQMRLGQWYLCRIEKALVSCRGAHSRNYSPCKANKKANLAKGGLVLCIMGHPVHTGQGGVGSANHGFWNKYAGTPQILYFCTDKQCTLQHRLQVHPKSDNGTQYFCIHRQYPSEFTKPSRQNLMLGPETTLNDAEKEHINKTFNTTF